MADDIRFSTVQEVRDHARRYGDYDRPGLASVEAMAHRSVVYTAESCRTLPGLAAELQASIAWEQAHPRTPEWRSKRRIQIWRWYLKHLNVNTEVRS